MSRWSLVGPHVLGVLALWHALDGDVAKALVALGWLAALAWAEDRARARREPVDP